MSDDATTDSLPDPLSWRPLKAPSLDEMHVIAEEAYRRLPQKFKALCEGLVIHVDDFPTDEVLDDLQAETEFDLLGLFQGIGLPFQSESTPACALSPVSSATSRSAVWRKVSPSS